MHYQRILRAFLGVTMLLGANLMLHAGSQAHKEAATNKYCTCTKPIKRCCSYDKHEPISVTRDAYGVPQITGGSREDVYFAIGRVQAEDRLFQLFQTVVASAGRLSEFFGAAGGANVNSDIFVRQTGLTTAEATQQFNDLILPQYQVLYQRFLDGINSFVDEVNSDVSKLPYELKVLGFNGNSGGNPLPRFTIPDLMKLAQVAAGGSSSNPTYQLTNISIITSLVSTYGDPTTAYQIFNDIYPIPQNVKTANTLVPNCDCKTASPIAQVPMNMNRPSKKKSGAMKNMFALSDNVNAFQEYLDALDEVKRNCYPKMGGSYGAVLAGSKTANGNPLLVGGPQTDLGAPSSYYQVHVDSPRANVLVDCIGLAGVPFVALGKVNNYAITAHSASLPVNDYLLEPVTNALYLQDELIKIKQNDGSLASITIKLYRSTSGGWVVDGVAGAIPPPFGMNLPLPPGVMLTLHSAFIGNQLQFLNRFFGLVDINSIEDFVAIYLNPDWTSDLYMYNNEYADADGNILVCSSGWTQLPATIDRRFPLNFALAPVIDNTAAGSYVIKDPLLDVNTKQGYYANWNNLFRQGTEKWDGFYRTVDRQYWVDDYIKSIDKLTFEDLQRLMLRVAKAQFNNAYRAGANTNASLFFLFKELFYQTILNNSPTTAQLQALAYLDDFDGSWFAGDANSVASSLDVNPKFLLANTWLTNVARSIINPVTSGTAAPTIGNPTAVTNPSPSANTLIMNTLARVLGLECDNTIFYNGWLNGIDLNVVIPAGLNQAFALLSPSQTDPFAPPAFPWGVGRRPIEPFDNSILGVVQRMPVFNAPDFFFVCEVAPCGVVREESIMPLGESGEVFGTPPVANPPYPVSSSFLTANPATYDVNSFSQQLLYSHFTTKNDAAFRRTQCALNSGICAKCGSAPCRGPARSKHDKLRK